MTATLQRLGVDTDRHGRRRRLGAEHRRPRHLPPADRGARPAHARPTRSAPGSRSPARPARWRTCSPTRRSPAGCMAKTGTLGERPVQRRPAGGQGAVAATCPSTAVALIEFALLLNSPGTLTDQSVYRPIWDSLRRRARRPTRRARPLADLAPAVERADGGDAVMPMFPLGTVLLPGEVLPLHVFEPRYRQLVIDCLADETGDREFGVGADRARPRGRRRRRSAPTSARSPASCASDALRRRPLRDAACAVGTRRIRCSTLAARRSVPDRRRRRLARRPPADDEPSPPAWSRSPSACATSDGSPTRRRAAAGPNAEAAPPTPTTGPARRRPAARQLPPGDVCARRPRRPLPAAAAARPSTARLDVIDGALDDVDAVLRFRLSSELPDRRVAVAGRTLLLERCR